MRRALEIDPAADYLVRCAGAHRRGRVEPEYIVDAAGMLAVAGRTANHVSRWAEGAAATPTSIAIEKVPSAADLDLIRQTEEHLDTTRGVGR